MKQFFFIMMLFLLAACGDGNTVEKQMNLLSGRWDLVEGTRNGKVTESLRDTYFEFTQDGKMSTNLPIKGGVDSDFEIKENVIVQTIVDDLKINYAIKELTVTSLKLSTKLRGYDFVFSMEKSTEDALSLVDISIK